MGQKKTVLSIAMLSLMRAPRESHYLLRFEINLDLDSSGHSGLLCCVGYRYLVIFGTTRSFQPKKAVRKEAIQPRKIKIK